MILFCDYDSKSRSKTYFWRLLFGAIAAVIGICTSNNIIIDVCATFAWFVAIIIVIKDCNRKVLENGFFLLFRYIIFVLIVFAQWWALMYGEPHGIQMVFL